MIDEPDPLLRRLFAEQSQPEHEAGFMEQFNKLMERDRRRRRNYGAGMIVAGVITAALLAPWIAQFAAITIGSVAEGVSAARSFLNFPMAWLVVCSILVSLLPGLYLGITRRW